MRALHRHKPTLKSWQKMIERCYSPSSISYPRYGGRGVTICDRWRGMPKRYEQFLEDMGERPEGTSLDRIDNLKGYSPENCRWASIEDQANNTRTNIWFEWHGKQYTLRQLLRHLGIHTNRYNLVYKRMHVYGWDLEKALVSPLQHGGAAPYYAPHTSEPRRTDTN